MTLSLERARTRRPVTWLTLLGVLLLPVLVGGILVVALDNPVERLDGIHAAIVNDDDPVTIDGQYVPLGRQLTAGLVEGSDDEPSNLTWTISNESDAAAGLADGRYDAVVTIPAGFSAAATSTAPGKVPERATIGVQTPPDSRIVDDAITAQVTQAAASLLGQQLSEVYLENVYLGFTTLGDRLGQAASGAGGLAGGATRLSDGVAQLADGASGAAAGAAELPGGAGQLASGARGLGDGAGQLATGLDALAAGARSAQGGAAELATKTRAGAAQVVATGIVPKQLLDYAAAAESSSAATAGAIGGVAGDLGRLAADCAASGASDAFCSRLSAIAGTAGTAAQTAVGAATDAAYSSGGLTQLATQAPAGFAAQLNAIADGADKLAAGMTPLAGGIDQSAAGARSLASGAGQLAGGADQLASGSQQLADGLGELADGTAELGTGASQLADGTHSLADGLSTAAGSVPSYTDAQARNLAEVVAKPVTAEGIGSSLFGASAIPLLATLALWFGGLATFVTLRAVPRDALTSRRPSVLLALRSLVPAAGIGALQGFLVACVVQLAASYDAGTWFAFAGITTVTGVVFAIVHQGFVAVFGGAGRWIAALVGVLAMATGVVSTVPGFLVGIADLMPTMPAYRGMLAALTTAGGAGAALAGLLAWSVVAFAATVIVVARRRSTSVRAVLAASPA